MNSIDAKGYSFLQQNAPGNDGYGQIGIKGDSGSDGNSVYFTPYVLSTVEGRRECIARISNGEELSDNPQYSSNMVEYKVNDYILDKLGNVYILKSWGNTSEEHEIPFNITYLNNIFSKGSVTGSSLQCILNISQDETSDYYYKKKYNDEFIGPYNKRTGSPYICHRDRYVSRLCGSWLYFTIPLSDQEYHDYIYKYVLVFPNGQRLEKMTKASSCEMFVDNRYFYGCRFSEDVSEELQNLAAYHSIEENSEYDFPFTYALVSNGIGMCKAYVEITNKDTHSTYRVYADTIRINDEYGQSNQSSDENE
jgi:hypothetical protein